MWRVKREQPQFQINFERVTYGFPEVGWIPNNVSFETLRDILDEYYTWMLVEQKFYKHAEILQSRGGVGINSLIRFAEKMCSLIKAPSVKIEIIDQETFSLYSQMMGQPSANGYYYPRGSGLIRICDLKARGILGFTFLHELTHHLNYHMGLGLGHKGLTHATYYTVIKAFFGLEGISV